MAIITISRQFGSEGLAVARRAAELLGYACLDKALVRDVARMADIPERLVEKYDEKGQGLIADLLRRAFLGSPSPSSSPGGEVIGLVDDPEPQYGKPERCWTPVQDDILSLTELIIRTAADRGNVVIVGRGAQIILADRPNTLRVRVTSPINVRCRRIAERYDVDLEEAMALIHRKDQDKARYLRQYYCVGLEDSDLYHLIINTERTGVEMAAHLIADGASFIDTKEEVRQKCWTKRH